MLLVMLAPLVIAAGAGPEVTEVLRPMISLYDVHGVLIRKAPKETVPAHTPIVGKNDLEQVGVRLATGETVYLRPSEIVTKGEVGPCLEVANATQASTRHVAASGGIQSGMSANSVACVHK